jgi:hypothetical protein
MDLSNYLLIRTRERLLLENKVNAPHKVMLSGSANKWTQQSTEMSLKSVQGEVTKHLEHLQKLINVSNEASINKLPVAFSTNALYILERNGAGNREDYERVLLPVLR